MKLFRALLAATAVLVCSLVTFAQGPKSFTKDGLSFSYPSGWTVQDASSNDAQQLTLARSDSEVQIRLFAYRGKITTPERLAEAQKKLVDPYIESTSRTFEKMGSRPQRSPATTEIGGVKAEGVAIRAVLEGEPGAAMIYWASVGERLVVLTLFGPDKALKKQTTAWDLLRNSVKIEAAKPATPSPE